MELGETVTWSVKAIKKTFENRQTPLPDSFLIAAQGIGLEVLRTAWGSVEMSAEGATFNSVWDSFLGVLRSLESNLHWN